MEGGPGEGDSLFQVFSLSVSLSLSLSQEVKSGQATVTRSAMLPPFT